MTLILVEEFVADWGKGIISSGSNAKEVLDNFASYIAPAPRYGLKWNEVDMEPERLVGP